MGLTEVKQMAGIKYKVPKSFKKGKRRMKKSHFKNVGEIERDIKRNKKKIYL